MRATYYLTHSDRGMGFYRMHVTTPDGRFTVIGITKADVDFEVGGLRAAGLEVEQIDWRDAPEHKGARK